MINGIGAGCVFPTINNLRAAGTPALSLDFLNPSLDSRITFTRASGGTRVNSAGLIETLTTDQPRFDYDPVTLAPRGLLIEESRTNLEQNTTAATKVTAGDTINTDGTLAPDGSLALKFLCDGTNAQHYFSRATAASTAATYTTSTYLKAGTGSFAQLGTAVAHAANAYCNYDLTTGAMTAGAGVIASSNFCTAVGGGWWRCGFSFADAGAGGILCTVSALNSVADTGARPTFTASTYFYQSCSQYELGAFPTSYIPTTTAAVTRAADVASMTGTNFSSWFNATEGTLVVKYDTANTSASQRCISLNDGTGPNRLLIRRENAGSNMSYLVSNVDQLTGFNNMGAFPYTGGSQAFAYKVNDFAASSFGGSVYTDASGSLMTPNLMDIGRDSQGGASINGHLQRITYYNKRLPDATLKALSA